MKTFFDQGMKDWIRANVDAGNDKDGIFRILSDEGYDYQAIKKEMNHEPSAPLCEIANPLAQAGEQVGNTDGSGNRDNYGAPIDRRYIYLPNAIRLDTERMELWCVDDFLLAGECARLVELIKSRLVPSPLIYEGPDKAFRTSRTCYMETLSDPLVARVENRISAYLGIDPTYSETVQGQYYEVGQEFKPHIDPFLESTVMAHHGGSLGQRTFTFMIYLNDVEQGGETLFPHLQTYFKPKPGRAVIWNNLHPDGRPNPCTLHHGTPVVRGYKALITKWFRTNSARRPAPPMYCKKLQEYVPHYTKPGIHREACPPGEFKEILRFYRRNARHQEPETDVGYPVHVRGGDKTGSSMVWLPAPLKKKIQDSVKPLLEAWAGVELEPVCVHGIRVYHAGAVLELHRDKEPHIISATIQVAQEVEKVWPLAIQDNYYRTRHVLLKPGEMLFYEGARLFHGRPQPLEGESFANVFVHFKPVGHVSRKPEDYPELAAER